MYGWFWLLLILFCHEDDGLFHTPWGMYIVGGGNELCMEGMPICVFMIGLCIVWGSIVNGALCMNWGVVMFVFGLLVVYGL